MKWSVTPNGFHHHLVEWIIFYQSQFCHNAFYRVFTTQNLGNLPSDVFQNSFKAKRRWFNYSTNSGVLERRSMFIQYFIEIKIYGIQLPLHRIVSLHKSFVLDIITFDAFNNNVWKNLGTNNLWVKIYHLILSSTIRCRNICAWVYFYH